MKITGPGDYRQQNGRKATVEYVNGTHAFGYRGNAFAQVWEAKSGEPIDGLRDVSIVGPWTEPQETWKPTGRVMWRRVMRENPYSRFHYGAPVDLHVEERSESGATRWVPVPVEA